MSCSITSSLDVPGQQIPFKTLRNLCCCSSHPRPFSRTATTKIDVHSSHRHCPPWPPGPSQFCYIGLAKEFLPWQRALIKSYLLVILEKIRKRNTPLKER